MRRLLVKRYPYSERDYTFGQLMLTLRTTIGLTQAGLGERLGVSRRAVAEWEAGLSYPKAERLKQLITLVVQQQGFPAGREAEEIRTLWKAAHQKVLLDDAWLAGLLAPPVTVLLAPPAATPVAPAFSEPTAFPRVDLVEALDSSHFTGREVEVAELSQWIVQERCCLVTHPAGWWFSTTTPRSTHTARPSTPPGRAWPTAR
jgi:transcriptional regulator with XRE-family HTH domain